MATRPKSDKDFLSIKFLRLKTKVHCLKADLFFLKSCRANKVFPKFMNIKCKPLNSRSEKVIFLSKLKWLSLERKYVHQRLYETELELYDIHSKILDKMNNQSYYEWWENQLITINEKVIKTINSKQAKLNKKLRKLINDNPSKTITK